MSDATSDRGRGGPPTRIDWNAEAERGAAASAARRGVSPERLADLDRELDRKAFKERFANARLAVLDRFGDEIRADAHAPFRRGRVERTTAVTETMQFLQGLHGRAAHGQQVLILSGGTGVGKTLAALYGLAWHTAARPELSFGEHVHAAKIAERVKPWRGEKADPLNIRTSYLVIDDLGAEKSDDDRFREAFDALVNARQGLVQGYRQVTIITTNEAPATLLERYGARVKSRLTGLTRGIELVGEDMRARRAS